MEFISSLDRRDSLKTYLSHIFSNGIAYFLLTDTIVLLLAMHFNASNMQLGWLSSAMYVTAVATLVTPILFSGVSLKHFYCWAWLLRGGLCAGYFLLLLPFCQNGRWDPLWVILPVYTLFCLVRNICWPVKQSLEALLLKPANTGRWVSRLNKTFGWSMFFSGLISYTVLSLSPLNRLQSLLFLVGGGIIINTTSSLSLLKLKVNNVVKTPQNFSLLKTWLSTFKDSSQRRTLGIYCIGQIGLLVLFGFSIAFMRRSIGLADTDLFLYTIFHALAVIASGYISVKAADYTGPRPLLIGSFLVLGVNALILAFIPQTVPAFIILFLCFISAFVNGMVNLQVLKLIMLSLPQDNRVGFSAMLNSSAAVAALLIGFSGGLLADLTDQVSWLAFNHRYSPTFLLSALLAFFCVRLARGLSREGSLSLPQTAQLFLSMQNIRALWQVESIKDNPSERKLDAHLYSLRRSPTNLATEELRRRLQSPLILEKEELIHTLFVHPRPELLDDLLAEAEDRDSWWRETALFTLGAYPDPKTEALLVRLYEEETYPYMKSIMAKSLARIGWEAHAEEIREQLRNTKLNIRTTVNYFIALSIVDKSGDYLRHLFCLARIKSSRKFPEHLFIIVGRRLNFHPAIERFLYQENLKLGDGFQNLLEEAIESPPIHRLAGTLNRAFQEKAYQQVIEQLISCLPEKRLLSERLCALVDGLPKALEAPDDLISLAVLFYVWQILKEVETEEVRPPQKFHHFVTINYD